MKTQNYKHIFFKTSQVFVFLLVISFWVVNCSGPLSDEDLGIKNSNSNLLGAQTSSSVLSEEVRTSRFVLERPTSEQDYAGLQRRIPLAAFFPYGEYSYGVYSDNPYVVYARIEGTDLVITPRSLGYTRVVVSGHPQGSTRAVVSESLHHFIFVGVQDFGHTTLPHYDHREGEFVLKGPTSVVEGSHAEYELYHSGSNLWRFGEVLGGSSEIGIFWDPNHNVIADFFVQGSTLQDSTTCEQADICVDISNPSLEQTARQRGYLAYTQKPYFDAIHKMKMFFIKDHFENFENFWVSFDPQEKNAGKAFRVKLYDDWDGIYPLTGAFAFEQTPEIENQTYRLQTSQEVNLKFPKAINGSGWPHYTFRPQIPEGLSFNDSTMTLVGIPTETLDETEYSFYAVDSHFTWLQKKFKMQIVSNSATASTTSDADSNSDSD